jgi:hypothetical protein
MMGPLSVASIRNVVAGRPSGYEAGAEKSSTGSMELPLDKSLTLATVQAAKA